MRIESASLQMKPSAPRNLRIRYAADEFFRLCLEALDVCSRADRPADHDRGNGRAVRDFPAACDEGGQSVDPFGISQGRSGALRRSRPRQTAAKDPAER